MKLSASDIADRVTMAFVLEAISYKQGCTHRLVDLPGKPLQDFLIAAINASRFFHRTAEKIIDHPEHTNSFEEFIHALQIVPRFSSGKFLTLGLLEAMFPAVHARLTLTHGEDVIDRLTDIVKTNGPEAVSSLLAARRIAWRTSDKASKRNFDPSPYLGLNSVEELYQHFLQDFPPSDSNYQWAHHALNGHYITRIFYKHLPSNITEMLIAIPTIYNTVRLHLPDIKVGILADHCAAAIFLKLTD